MKKVDWVIVALGITAGTFFLILGWNGIHGDLWIILGLYLIAMSLVHFLAMHKPMYKRMNKRKKGEQ